MGLLDRRQRGGWSPKSELWDDSTLLAQTFAPESISRFLSHGSVSDI